MDVDGVLREAFGADEVLSAADGVDERDVPGTVSACVNPGVADADTARNELLMSMEGVCL